MAYVAPAIYSTCVSNSSSGSVYKGYAESSCPFYISNRNGAAFHESFKGGLRLIFNSATTAGRAFSMGVWVKFLKGTGGLRFHGKYDHTVMLFIIENEYYWINIPRNIILGKWNHYQVNRNSSKYIEFLINGTIVYTSPTTSTTSTLFDQTCLFVIGDIYDKTTNGSIPIFAEFNVSLTSATSFYNASAFSVTNTGSVAALSNYNYSPLEGNANEEPAEITTAGSIFTIDIPTDDHKLVTNTSENTTNPSLSTNGSGNHDMVAVGSFFTERVYSTGRALSMSNNLYVGTGDSNSRLQFVTNSYTYYEIEQSEYAINALNLNNLFWIRMLLLIHVYDWENSELCLTFKTSGNNTYTIDILDFMFESDIDYQKIDLCKTRENNYIIKINTEVVAIIPCNDSMDFNTNIPYILLTTKNISITSKSFIIIKGYSHTVSTGTVNYTSSSSSYPSSFSFLSQEPEGSGGGYMLFLKIY